MYCDARDDVLLVSVSPEPRPHAERGCESHWIKWTRWSGSTQGNIRDCSHETPNTRVWRMREPEIMSGDVKSTERVS